MSFERIPIPGANLSSSCNPIRANAMDVAVSIPNYDTAMAVASEHHHLRNDLMEPKTYAQGLRFALGVFERRTDVANLPIGSMFRRMYDEIAVELASANAESARNEDYMNALANKDPEMDGGAGA